MQQPLWRQLWQHPCWSAAAAVPLPAAQLPLPPSTPAESTAESTAADTTADGDETLTVWAWDPNFNIYALKQAEAIYQKDHPNFKLNIEENVYSDIETKLITAATSEDYSTLPDLFLMQDYSYHKMVANFPGIYTDLTDSGLIGTSSPAASWLILPSMATTTVCPSTTALPSWRFVPI